MASWQHIIFCWLSLKRSRMGICSAFRTLLRSPPPPPPTLLHSFPTRRGLFMPASTLLCMSVRFSNDPLSAYDSWCSSATFFLYAKLCAAGTFNFSISLAGLGNLVEAVLIPEDPPKDRSVWCILGSISLLLFLIQTSSCHHLLSWTPTAN